jgi:hypothetical protein
MKGPIICVLILLSWGIAPAQAVLHRQQPKYILPPQIPEDLNVALEPLDSAAIAFGLTEREVNDVLRLSAESTGWEFRTGADNVITVKLTPLPQQQEDLFAFQIDVAAGAIARPVHEGIGGLSVSSVVNVPAGGSVKLLAQINQLVLKVSRRFREEVMKRSMRENERVQPPDD